MSESFVTFDLAEATCGIFTSESIATFDLSEAISEIVAFSNQLYVPDLERLVRLACTSDLEH